MFVELLTVVGARAVIRMAFEDGLEAGAGLAARAAMPLGEGGSEVPVQRPQLGGRLRLEGGDLVQHDGLVPAGHQ